MQTWMLNIRALDLVKEIKWPFFGKLYDVNDLKSTLQAKVTGDIIYGILLLYLLVVQCYTQT